MSSRIVYLKLAGISNKIVNLPIYCDLYHLLGQLMQFLLKLVGQKYCPCPSPEGKPVPLQTSSGISPKKILFGNHDDEAEDNVKWQLIHMFLII